MHLVIIIMLFVMVAVFLAGYASGKSSKIENAKGGPFIKWSRGKRLQVAEGLRRQAKWLTEHVPDDNNPEMQIDMHLLAEWLEEKE